METGTLSRCTSAPRPAAAAISLVAQAIPPAPRSFIPKARPFPRRWRQAALFASVSTRDRNGSGTCTAPRFSSPSSRSTLAKAAPPKPESSVALPTRT